MDATQKKWLVRGGIGIGACALLTAWMVPDTTPVGRPSPLAGMAAAAEAQKPTFSAVPDSAIPRWAAAVRPAPSAMPETTRTPLRSVDRAPVEPSDVLETALTDVAGQDEGSADAPPQTPQVSTPPSPAPDGYQARRAEWQARLASTMQGQAGPD